MRTSYDPVKSFFQNFDPAKISQDMFAPLSIGDVLLDHWLLIIYRIIIHIFSNFNHCLARKR